MAKTLPGYTRYPGDYLMQPVASCSLAAQMLWVRMEDLMHVSERYGFLVYRGKPMPSDMVARRLTLDHETYLTLFQELDDADVISRERRTEIIYSEALEAQAAKRAGTKNRVQKHRRKSELETETKSSRDGFEISIDLGNSMETKDECNNFVTRPPLGKGNGEGDGLGTGIVFSFKPPGEEILLPAREEESPPDPVVAVPPPEPSVPPLRPILPPESQAVQDAAAARRRSLGLLPAIPASAKPLNPKPETGHLGLLIEEIAVASPAGVALAWTPLSMHGNSRILNPIMNAVALEATEQGMGEPEAALWLLDQVRSVTAVVRVEAGWEGYWTAKRMVGFYEDTEYRNVSRFNKNGTGGSNGKRGGRAGHNQSVLEELDRQERAARDVAGAVRGGAGGHAGPGDQPDDAAGLCGVPESAYAAGVRGSVHAGGGGVAVLPAAGRAAGPRW